MKKLSIFAFALIICFLLTSCINLVYLESSNSALNSVITSSKTSSFNSNSTNSNKNSTTASTSSSEGKKPDVNAELNELTLDQTNTPNEISREPSSVTAQIADTEFMYENAFVNNQDSHVSLQKAGYITNIDPIGDIRTIVINYDFIEPNDVTYQNEYGFGYLKYRISNNFIDNPNDYGTYIKTVGEDYIIDLSENADDFFISFWSPRMVDINFLDITYAEDEYVRNNQNFTIQVFSTNDIHGQVKNADGYPGLSALTTKMNSIASEKDQFNIFIDQGDLYQGTAEAGLTNGYNMDDFLLINGYESTTLGNHEFDWGEKRISEHVDYSPVTILANNVRYTADDSAPAWTTPYKLVSRNGVKIGIIGSLGNVLSSISASKVNGIKFLTGSALTEQIKKDSTALKNLGADFIILSLHDGDSSSSNGTSSLSYYDINSLSKTYVDLVLEGHSHQNYAFYDSKGVWHVQNSGNGSTFHVSELECTYSNGEYTVSLSTSVAPKAYTSTSSASNEIINEMDSWYSTYLYGSKQSEIVGKNVPYMYSDTFEDLTAELYYNYGLEMTKNTKYQLALGGGFIRTRTPYNLSGGTVTYGQIFNLLPFDNDLVLCSVSGSNLKSKFIQTSNSDYHVYGISASEVVNSKTYYILTDSYTSDYAYNNLTVVENYTIEYGLYARDLVANYLKQKYL